MTVGLTVGPGRQGVPSRFLISAEVPVKKAWAHAVAAARSPVAPAAVGDPGALAEAEAVPPATPRATTHPTANQRLTVTIH